MIKTHPHKISLASAVTLLAALVAALSMVVYAVFQYTTSPNDNTVTGLVIEHSWHVVALGSLTYLVMYIAIQKHMGKALRALFLKCYAMSTGDLSPVRVKSSIREIQTITDGLNYALSKISEDAALITDAELYELAAQLKQASQAGDDRQWNSAEQERILRVARRLEEAADISQQQWDSSSSQKSVYSD